VLRDAEAAWLVAKRLNVPSLLDAVLAYAGQENATPGSTALHPGAPRSQRPAATPGNTVSITFRQLFDQFEVYHVAGFRSSLTRKRMRPVSVAVGKGPWARLYSSGLGQRGPSLRLFR
jgi:hypothetical protein